MNTPRSFWSYQASEPTPTVDDLPRGAFSGTQREFEKLTPGMRREIARAARILGQGQPDTEDEGL